ncbi:hypothetical protein [Amycolatopsis nigrescens]|uniref:hypothetical protein n=1 Tax=Amycolatopsis nigrescens TaxID=381445 RepID=UPI00035E8E21|nr:hypothetical protein [Amycolatopsis nigrescens]
MNATSNSKPGTAEAVLCIDADCPACGWPERWLSMATRLFGCPKCPYTSTERDT